MLIGAVAQQPHGRTSTISAGWSFPEPPEVRHTQTKPSNSIWDHVQVSLQGSVFMEAISEEHKGKLYEHLQRQSGYPPKKTVPTPIPLPSQVAKEISKGGLTETHGPFQKAAGAKVPIGAQVPQKHLPAVKPGPPKVAPVTGPAKDPTTETNVAGVSYAQVGVPEMSSEYNLVQCRVIHADKSYDCTLDSGSCLNLIHWRTQGVWPDRRPSRFVYCLQGG